MTRHCLALDLIDDLNIIMEYEHWHKSSWPEIKLSITDSGITDMEIYRTGNRLFMIIETDASFSFERKAKMDKENLRVQEWETLMGQFQQALPWAKENEKWVLMKRIFKL